MEHPRPSRGAIRLLLAAAGTPSRCAQRPGCQARRAPRAAPGGAGRPGLQRRRRAPAGTRTARAANGSEVRTRANGSSRRCARRPSRNGYPPWSRRQPERQGRARRPLPHRRRAWRAAVMFSTLTVFAVMNTVIAPTMNMAEPMIASIAAIIITAFTPRCTRPAFITRQLSTDGLTTLGRCRSRIR